MSVFVDDDEEGDVSTSQHQELVTAYQEPDDDGHPPPTPPGAMESLFLSGLATTSISASCLAEQIHHRHRPFSLAGTSIATDDFLSATDVLHSSLIVGHDNDELNNTQDIDDDTPFGNDALIHTREILIEEHSNQAEQQQRSINTKNMATKTETKPMQADPAEKFYGTAKGAWAWGKGVFLFSPFMGIAEGIAGKIVQTAGSNMEE